MKRVVLMIIAAVLCVAMVCPAFAAEGDFVPSISYKDTPEIVTILDANGQPALASVHRADSTIVGYIYESCLLLTPVSEAATSTLISAEAAQQLLKIYNDLDSGALVLPFEDIDPDLKPEEMVIRDLFDASWICDHDHSETTSEQGVYVQITFDMGVDANTELYGMVYMSNQITPRNGSAANKQWVPMESLTINSDGTVTCSLEDVGAIAFAVHTKTPPAQTGDQTGRSLYLWIGVMAVSAVALVTVFVAGRRKNAR